MERRKKKVLIADDDPAVLDFLTIFLEGVGYGVESTGDGARLETFPADMPDLLLLDIRMSGWNGCDLCRRLKSQETTRQLPIVLFSANKEVETMAREAGADDFLAKPFDLEVLLEKIERWL
jgi:CheY-like chemotaxis protein